MYKNHIFLFDNDLKLFPPIINNSKLLLKNGCKVQFWGYCSAPLLLKELEVLGLEFRHFKVDKVEQGKVKKIIRMWKHKAEVTHALKTSGISSETVVWVYGNQNSWWRFHTIIKDYRSVLYMFEFPELKVRGKHHLIVPFFNIKKAAQSAWKTVACEYNRAQITKAIFDLKETPHVIENKPEIDFDDLNKTDISKFLPREIIEKLDQKKIILFQGGINDKMSRLDQLCEAIVDLPEDYILCFMSPESPSKRKLMEKFQSERIIFLPFINPPYHLKMTQLAHIGIMSYHPYYTQIEPCLNMLYCAPNKLYEYAGFGLPMISNNVPALQQSFKKHNSGVVLDAFNSSQIKNAILEISDNYQKFKKGAFSHYKSFNLSKALLNIIS